jgi:endonuclease-3
VRRAGPRAAAVRRRRPGRADLLPHAREIQRRLAAEYPDAHCELDHANAFQLACATILSAQCTDRRVNLVTPELFRRWPAPEDLARAPLRQIESVIRSTGFFRNKAKSLKGLAKALVAEHGSEIPRTIPDLVALPGIGRKTANVILGNAFGLNEGIVVDTHVARLAKRFGLTKESDPVRIERALIPLFERPTWAMLSHLLIWHGRRICDARRPRCTDCVLANICPSSTS